MQTALGALFSGAFPLKPQLGLPHGPAVKIRVAPGTHFHVRTIVIFFTKYNIQKLNLLAKTYIN